MKIYKEQGRTEKEMMLKMCKSKWGTTSTGRKKRERKSKL